MAPAGPAPRLPQRVSPRPPRRVRRRPIRRSHAPRRSATSPSPESTSRPAAPLRGTARRPEGVRPPACRRIREPPRVPDAAAETAGSPAAGSAARPRPFPGHPPAERAPASRSCPGPRRSETPRGLQPGGSLVRVHRTQPSARPAREGSAHPHRRCDATPGRLPRTARDRRSRLRLRWRGHRAFGPPAQPPRRPGPHGRQRWPRARRHRSRSPACGPLSCPAPKAASVTHLGREELGKSQSLDQPIPVDAYEAPWSEAGSPLLPPGIPPALKPWGPGRHRPRRLVQGKTARSALFASSDSKAATVPPHADTLAADVVPAWACVVHKPPAATRGHGGMLNLGRLRVRPPPLQGS